IALRRCDGTSTVRYRDLVVTVNALAAQLTLLSVRPGDRVLIVSDNGPETYLAVLACARTGAIAVMADGRLPPATIDRFRQITTPSVILTTPGARLKTDNPPQSVPTIAVDIDAASYDGSTAPSAGVSGQDAETPLAMIFTSGTTGEPKAVLLA